MYDYDGSLHFLAQHERRQYPPVALACSVCGDDICDGDRYWTPFGRVMCGGCLDDEEHVAEAPDMDNWCHT